MKTLNQICVFIFVGFVVAAIVVIAMMLVKSLKGM